MTIKSGVITLILAVLTTSASSFASQEKLSSFDAETAEKLRLETNIGIRINSIGPGTVSFEDNNIEQHEIFINKNNEVDFKGCNINSIDSSKTTCSRGLHYTIPYNKDNCNEHELKTDGVQLPLHANFICSNKNNFLIALYEDLEKDVVHIVGRNKGEKEYKVIKNIVGKKIIPIYDTLIHDYHFNTFAITNDVMEKTGSTLISIDKYNGIITEYNEPFLLNVNEIEKHIEPATYNNEIYFVGLDQNLYKISQNNPEKKLVWENKTGLEIVEFGLNYQHSFIKLRAYGQNLYKFFNKEFSTELSTEYNIIKFNYLDSSAISSQADSIQEYHPTDNSFAIITKCTGNLPPTVYIARWYVDGPTQQEKSQLKLFKDFSIDYKNIEFVKPYSIIVKNPNDGTHIPVNVWPARGASINNPKPMIIYIHGGPSANLDINEDGFSYLQYLATHGYWVICPETRGSTGYGEEHKNALINNWGQNHIDDIIAVADKFKTQAGVDSHKVFLMGHSFGGYSTLAAATRSDITNYFDGYVAISGLSEVGKDLYEEISRGDNEIDKRNEAASRKALVGFAAYENYSINSKNIKISPFYHTKNLNKPLLLIHGKNDSTVFPNQSEDFFWRAKDSEKQVAAVMIEGEGHCPSIYSHVVLPLKFFNDITSEKTPSILNSNTPIYTDIDGIRKLCK